MKTVSTAGLALVLSCAAALHAQAPPTARAEVEGPRSPFVFHNGFWINLHHYLYVLGRIEAGMPDVDRRAVAGAPDDEARGLGALSGDERRAWREAVSAYAAGASRGDLVFDESLAETGGALARAGNATTLAGTGVEADLAAILERVAPIYRKAWWEEHRAANRRRIAELEAEVERLGAAVLDFVTRVYGEPWPAAGYPVQMSAYTNWAGAYSTVGELLVMASLDDATRGPRGLETLFHEAMHQWDDSLQRRLRAEILRQEVRVPRGLSHAVVFFTAGEAVRRLVPGYVPYAEAEGIWEQGMAPLREALEAAWRPYLDGEGTLDEAAARLVAAAAEAGARAAPGAAPRPPGPAAP